MSDIEINNLYESIAIIIENAHKNVRRSVNETMVICYWSVGREIVEQEQQGKIRAEYGKAVLTGLAKRLTARFGQGFDSSNLRRMRQFFLVFPKRDALRHVLSWTHYRCLLKVEDEKARRWYDDNPTIGLILCVDKNESLAKYSLLADNKQLFASRYKLYLPSEEELQRELDRELALLEKELNG